jgi:hypothetical protein
MSFAEKINKIMGISKPFQERLADKVTANSTSAVAPAKPMDYVKPEASAPVKFGLPNIDVKPAMSPNPARLRRSTEEFIGTNYDPYDPLQTKPNPDGIGSSGVKLDKTMVASSFKEDGVTANLRNGTVILIPGFPKPFLVADVMNKRFNGMNKIDFVDPESKGSANPTLNKNFTGIEILREGSGRADARDFVSSGEWAKMLAEFEN